MSYSFSSPTPQWSSFVSRDLDWKGYASYPANKTDLDDQLDLLIEAACQWIQEYLGRPIAPTEFFRRFDGWSGWGGAYVFLPYYPVLEVVNITEWWGLSGPHVLGEQTPEDQGSGSNSYQIDPIVGKVIRTFPGLVQKPFFPGSRNVEITWIAGFSPIPAQLRMAALELATYWYRNVLEQPRIAVAGGSPFGETEDHNDLWPAVPNRVTMLLEPFTQVGVG